MMHILVDIVKFCLRWAVKLWPLWLVVLLRGLAADLWDYLRLAYAAEFQRSMPDTLARAGHFVFEALGPVPLLVIVLVLVGAKFRPKQDVTYAAGGVALSGAWSILENYWYLRHAYTGVNILNAAPLISPGVAFRFK